MPPSILLTIDVEDWFQVENFLKLTRFIEYFGLCRFVGCRQHFNKVADGS